MPSPLVPPAQSSGGRSATVVVTNDQSDPIIDILLGRYVDSGKKNDGQVVFSKEDKKSIYLYYWGPQDGPEQQGWWFGDAVGGNQVWCWANSVGYPPPVYGWKVPVGDEPAVNGFQVRVEVSVPPPPPTRPPPAPGASSASGSRRPRPPPTPPSAATASAGGATPHQPPFPPPDTNKPVAPTPKSAMAFCAALKPRSMATGPKVAPRPPSTPPAASQIPTAPTRPPEDSHTSVAAMLIQRVESAKAKPGAVPPRQPAEPPPPRPPAHPPPSEEHVTPFNAFKKRGPATQTDDSGNGATQKKVRLATKAKAEVMPKPRPHAPDTPPPLGPPPWENPRPRMPPPPWENPRPRAPDHPPPQEAQAKLFSHALRQAEQQPEPKVQQPIPPKPRPPAPAKRWQATDAPPANAHRNEDARKSHKYGEYLNLLAEPGATVEEETDIEEQQVEKAAAKENSEADNSDPLAAFYKERKVEERQRKLCDKSHSLEYCLDGSHTCNRCGRKRIKPPEHVYRCSICDFDLCKDCYGEEDVAMMPVDDDYVSSEEEAETDLKPRAPDRPPPPWRMDRRAEQLSDAALSAQPQTPPWKDKEDRASNDEDDEDGGEVDQKSGSELLVDVAAQWAEMQRNNMPSKRKAKTLATPCTGGQAVILVPPPVVKDSKDPLGEFYKERKVEDTTQTLLDRLLGRWRTVVTKSKAQQWHEILESTATCLKCITWQDDKPDSKRTTRISIENGEVKWGKGEVKLDIQSLTSTKLTWVWQVRKTSWDWQRGWEK